MGNEPNGTLTNPIDVVIAWVDGSDPQLAAKRATFQQKEKHSSTQGASPTRFASVNEIKYCVLSILRFAPFVRNIFIVTDNQTPPIWDDVKTYFPNRVDSIRIVDHKEIFEGYEQYLPTFNSISIESMLWRIKGLADSFVYFNDDMFIVKPLRPDDWFINNKPVLRVSWFPAAYPRVALEKLAGFIKKRVFGYSHYEPTVSFHIGQWNSAKLLGFRLAYLDNSHTPYPVGNSLVSEFLLANDELLRQNIAFRFRAYSQHTFIGLSNHLQHLNGNRNKQKPCVAYMQPYNRNSKYIDRKIRFCETNPNVKFLCVQSLDMCGKEDQQKVLGWMERILKL